MDKDELRNRAKQFALRVMRLCRTLPNTPDGRVIANQLLRSGTAVGANYRAVCRSRSKAEFAARLAVVLEEADESIFWLELLTEGAVLKSELIIPLRAEAEELVRIFGAAERTTRSQIRNPKSQFPNSV
jgi:four helix bundle protein